MSTYPGLSTRESVSLDEDEMSDVEDEVFIRDGRSSYKLAEDRGVKRPLMAPRRKVNKPDLASRLKNRPPCRLLCVPCCYAFAALTIFLGLIVLVIILVSLFPLPLDRLKSWIITKTSHPIVPKKVLPCNDLLVTDLWSYNLPKLASESALRKLDINADGVEDIIFGFGLGEDVQLPQQWFCPVFMGVKPPCQGGVMALDGATGLPVWKKWLPHMVFTLFCSTDFNGDQVWDCLASGKGGVLSAINSQDGTIIWEFVNNKTSLVMDIYSGSIIPDQDNDGILDVIAAHTIQTGGNRMGNLLIISGKTGLELSRISTPNSTECLFAPQLFIRDSENMILFGTGSQDIGGALYMAPLKDIVNKQMNPIVLYEDPQKGVLSPVILVDITGDQHPDIISAMFNTTIVAIDGRTLVQIWNYTVNNSETLSTPTPGYFTSDNVTDFLIKYQTGPGFPLYYYSQTIIIDGSTGRPIYNRPVIDTVGTQMSGLTISMENYGQDLFVYWLADCKYYEGRQDTYSFGPTNNIWQKTKANLCKLRFNSTMVAKLYALNQYMGPPGVLLYSSENRTSIEYNNSKTPADEVRQYLKENPDFDIIFRNSNPQLEDRPNLSPGGPNLEYRNMKLTNGGSNFRHRDDGQGLVKDFQRDDIRNHINNNEHPEDDYDNPDILLDPSLDYPDSSYPDESNPRALPNLKSNFPRDPRSKPELTTPTNQKYHQKRKIKKKNLIPPDEIYTLNDYKNIYLARNRLLHDLNDLPNEILRETYLKTRQLRDNKFQQRDLRYRENEEGKPSADSSDLDQLPESLWDLESEKELEDRENGYFRGKRDTEEVIPAGIPRITSTGIIMNSLADASSKNSIDIVFATYWVYPKKGAQVILEKDAQCIRQKMLQSTSPNDKYYNLEKLTKEDLFTKMCLEERGVVPPMNIYDTLQKSPYYNQIAQLTLGQMTVYRMRLECKCEILNPNERCARFLNSSAQTWPEYMGRFGDGTVPKYH